ncbi:hydroxyethylthiazole kinase [Aerococcus kribbianus]|uniref:Hydroxyethylthiazole kinase n=1 Tax=Aerococcus kribbianus TaxID=2999064 RepID=A0A9X3FMX7_9LACT|nr:MULTISPECIES: hydroxyethylthiazole kinase [unclassified Aerococcus]MCZ0717219.1 hydroxyethylthiazole kinase [Aerococcus sp. YH-aer221]MCZ0725507.1 hydroxyethylthiazole kinase [Aerococcus sp. YH-aer222]
MPNYQAEIAACSQAVRDKMPFTPSITNVVTVNLVANAQIAVGGRPAMLYLADEGINMVQACDSFYINLGTLFPSHREAVQETIASLQASHKAWVLDPVGLGKGADHNALIAYIKDHPATIIKANASEIMTLAQTWGLISQETEQNYVGVDSRHEVNQAQAAALALARHSGGVVVVTGQSDLVTDGNRMLYSLGGSDWMEKITGAGCILGGVMAVYAAVAQDPFIAALTAINAFNLAGKQADGAKGPASFQTQFIDRLYQNSAREVSQIPVIEQGEED